MSGDAAFLILCSLLTVSLFWAVPRRYGQDAVAIATVAGIAALSPLSALWLCATVVATPAVLQLGAAFGRRGAAVAIWGALLVGMLLAARELEGFLWIGGAYFTLRHLHVMIDWWRESIDRPTLRQYLHYHLFLPVIMAGPIHRIQNFRRQTERRRWDPAAFCCGAERLLLGAGQYVVVAGWLLEKVKALILAEWPGPGGFGHEWLLSVFFWVQLYLSFSALTSIALGLALMMGLKLEENFDRPWAAPDLVAFWTRWHMTLSHWCRDYVFRSVAALTRLPVVGLVAAMLAMGLWHDSSLYYVLWAMWQSLGIVVTRLWLRHVPVDLPRSVARVAGPAFVLVWLTLTRPVIVEVMGAFA